MAETTEFTIGRDVGVFGRWFRLLVGLAPLALTAMSIQQEPIPAAEKTMLAGATLLYFVLAGGVYFAAFYFIDQDTLSRMHPWLATLIFYGPVFAVTLFDLGPQAFHLGLSAYIAVSLIFNFAMNYGGCEVVSIPSLILRRRHTVYCPWNAVDVVERSVVAHARTRQAGGVAAALIIAVVGGYFLFAEFLGLFRAFGFSFDVDDRWALLLLAPVAYLGWRAWAEYQDAGRRLSASARRHAVGALVILSFSAIFAFRLEWTQFWAAFMVAGVLMALVEIRARRLRSDQDTA